MPRSSLLQVRQGTAAVWTSVNPTLAAGEIGYETDTGRKKVGDGSTAWSSLAYDDAAARARANHTGTQTASTISDFDTAVTTSTIAAVLANGQLILSAALHA